MSTFCGRIQEIPDISVDRFNEENFYSTVYFLSHCHTDHMVGLADWRFQSFLTERPNVFLYASSISLNILRNMFPLIQGKLKELLVDTPTLITFPNDPNRTLSVTTIPAGHCPGSVMFLFETDKNILYTGDYRVQLSDLQKFKAFYSLNKIKKIDKIYLDTTFFNRFFNKLPSRQETAQVICKAIQEWISQGKDYIVKIETSAKYGSEYLFAEVAQCIGIPIHVREEVYKLYKCVPELDFCVTLNGQDTQIHTACGPSYEKICRTCPSNNLLIIKPSVQWWKGNNFENGIYAKHNGLLRVCYSSHASFEEIKEFLMFLKPLAIEPCVVPSMFGTEEQLYTDIKNVSDNFQQPNLLVDETIYRNHKEIEIKINNFHCGSSEQITETLDAILRSSPKDFKRKRLWLGDGDSA